MSEEKRFLSAEEILAVEDIKIAEVDVPEWGGVVRLRPMSGEEAEQFVSIVSKDKTGAAIKVVAMCAVKEDGLTRLFTEEQVGLLKKKALRAIMRLQKKAMEINGLNEEGLAETKNA